MEEKEYLDKYEQTLTSELLKVCTQQGRLQGRLLPSPDLDDQWERVAESYLGDAVKEIAAYPAVALGWMMYVGMGIAHVWDKDWKRWSQLPNIYEHMRDMRGFDCLDEYVREGLLGLTGQAYDDMQELVRMCSMIALSQIRRENVEPQSPMAFHVYVRSIHALYIIGSSIELHRLGYKMSAQ